MAKSKDIPGDDPRVGQTPTLYTNTRENKSNKEQDRSSLGYGPEGPGGKQPGGTEFEHGR